MQPDAIAVGSFDCRLDLGDIGIHVDDVMLDAHVVEDRFDDAHAVTRRCARREVRIVLQQADHHADRLLVFDGDAANGIDGIEKAGVLDQNQGALIGIRESGSDADALVFFADANQPE